jgi:hypothetical protein
VARRAQPIFRITRLFYQFTWAPVAAAGRHIRSGERRERFLSLYGPLSLLVLLGSWASVSSSGSPCCNGRLGSR